MPNINAGATYWLLVSELCKDMGMEQRSNIFAYRARTDYNLAFNHILSYNHRKKE